MREQDYRAVTRHVTDACSNVALTQVACRLKVEECLAAAQLIGSTPEAEVCAWKRVCEGGCVSDFAWCPCACACGVRGCGSLVKMCIMRACIGLFKSLTYRPLVVVDAPQTPHTPPTLPTRTRRRANTRTPGEQECSDDLPAGPEGSRHVTGMKPQTPNPTLQTQTLHLKPKPQTLHT